MRLIATGETCPARSDRQHWRLGGIQSNAIDELRCTQIDYDSLAVGVMETRFHGNLRSVDDHLDYPLAPGP